MSEVTTRTVSVIRHEYLVPSGCAGAELMKAVAMAINDMPESRRNFDDAYRVVARDEEVVVYWIEERTET